MLGRPPTMRRSSLVLGTVLLGLAVAPFPTPPATGSCAAPSLDVGERASFRPGASATVTGRGFVEGCNDTGGCGTGFGCDDCEEEPVTPYDDVELRLRQHGRTWPLGVTDAGTAADDELGQVTWTFLVPRDVARGRATLVTDYSSPVRIRIP